MKRKKQKWLSLLLACACLTGAAAVPITASETDPLQAVSAESPEEALENAGEMQEDAESAGEAFTKEDDLSTHETMEVRFDVAGSARKALAAAIGEHTGAYPSYQAAPSFAYLIGEYTLDRTGTLAGPKNDYLIRALAEDGYQTK